MSIETSTSLKLRTGKQTGMPQFATLKVLKEPLQHLKVLGSRLSQSARRFMYKGIIIENSLFDKEILKKVQINKTWESGDWVLHDVLLKEEQVAELSKSLDTGPWYIHVWKKGKDEVKVIYKDKVFDIKFSDKSTWVDAVNYGKSIGIPEKQLNFPID